MDLKKDYEQWVDKACKFINEVGPRINRCGSGPMQSAPVLDHHPEVVFLGHDAHEDYEWQGGKEEEIRRRFFEGNPFFIVLMTPTRIDMIGSFGLFHAIFSE